MTRIPVTRLDQLEVGMVVESGDWVVQLAYCPEDGLPYKGTPLLNKCRNKWLGFIIGPKEQAERFQGQLQLVCFDLLMRGTDVYRLEPEERWPLTNIEQRFIAFSA